MSENFLIEDITDQDADICDRFSVSDEEKSCYEYAINALPYSPLRFHIVLLEIYEK